jgi:hypothetical protein
VSRGRYNGHKAIENTKNKELDFMFQAEARKIKVETRFNQRRMEAKIEAKRRESQKI